MDDALISPVMVYRHEKPDPRNERRAQGFRSAAESGASAGDANKASVYLYNLIRGPISGGAGQRRSVQIEALKDRTPTSVPTLI